VILVSEAQAYLAGFHWAHPGKMWVGECIPGVIAIFQSFKDRNQTLIRSLG